MYAPLVVSFFHGLFSKSFHHGSMKVLRTQTHVAIMAGIVEQAR